MTPDSALTGQLVLAAVSSWAIQKIKSSKWFPWITMESQKLNRWVGGLVAFAASAGIVVSFDTTGGVLTISGLTLVALRHFAWRFGSQWVLQQVSYRLLVAPPMPGALQAGAKEIPPVLKLNEPPAAKE